MGQFLTVFSVLAVTLQADRAVRAGSGHVRGDIMESLDGALGSPWT